ncbi:hypothetical protein DENIS_1238 [Desulfonema ishimotonii]|uniref:Uncharacterized protein n=1 Tax=Desulfonema ishimotonii TaxID=45657 RepID=A0A401FTH4_9BACT|nr:hypothetical protein [Desulfonema ishimotonii]GBC60287.1 hypothetical protein DENIS_1238 [Desulfonema ishimotonii]
MKPCPGSIQKKIGCVLIILMLMCLSGNGQAEEPEREVTPTDIYYLVKSINDSLAILDGINNTFSKKQISDNLTPRNVYEMASDTIGKFVILHQDDFRLVEKPSDYQMDTDTDCCRSAYALIRQVWDHIIENHLSEMDDFMLPFEERTTKTPSDVFQALRRLSFHCDQLAQKRGINEKWAIPARVYEAVVTEILPELYDIADETGIQYTPYAFPEQPVKDARPRHVYKLLCYTYKNIADYYARKENYPPVIFAEINDCDEITPPDVYAVAQIISAELKMKNGNRTVSPEILDKYSQWKAAKSTVVSGDVFRLIQYNFLLGKKVLKSAA